MPTPVLMPKHHACSPGALVIGVALVVGTAVVSAALVVVLGGLAFGW